MPSRHLLALTVALLSLPAVAHKVPRGVYTQVPYNNNPDMFCKFGMPKDGWISVVPKRGKWKPISQYYNPKWIPTFVYVCSAAGRPAGGGGKYVPTDSAAAQ